MTTLADIRKQYPQYNDMPDGALADAIYSKHYSDIPRAEFDKRVGLSAPAPSEPQRNIWPQSLAEAGDATMDAFRGFNKGVAEFMGGPYRALDWGIEKVTGGDGLKNLEDLPVWGYYLKPPPPQTTLGKYIRSTGEGIGGAALPVAGTLSLAERALPAAGQATSTLGGIWRGVLDSYRSNPAAAVATDLAAAGGSGVGAEAAREAGFGPVGQTVGAVVGGLVPGGIAAYRTPTNTAVGSPTAQGISRRRFDEATRDAEAFDNQGVRPFGPAFNQGPVASIGKQITETPFVGAPLRNNLDETIHDAAAATQALSDRISPNAMAETAGQSVQRGLERYGRDGVTRIDPDRLTAIGINPDAPIQPRQTMSAEAAHRLTQAEQIRTQERTAAYNTARAAGATDEEAMRTAMAQVPPLAQGRNQMMQARRGVEDLSDSELTRLRTTPSVDTSFAARREAEYEHAWRMIPTQFRANASVNPQRVGAVNLRQALDQVQGQIANQISGQGVVDGPLAARIANPRAHFSLGDLRAIRTEIGRSMDEYNPTQQTLSQSQLRNLYAAASRDLEVGVQDLANRALINSQLPASNPAHVPPAVANEASRALRAFQRADQYTRAGMQRMERFNAVLGTDNPQQAAQRLITAATDGTRGNMQMYRSAMKALRPEDRADFGALTVRELGRPVPSARGIVQEADWSPNSFVTRYTKMSPEARNLVFTPEHQRDIEDIFRIANRLANVEALANTSRSGTNAINLGGAAAGMSSLAVGDITTPLMIGGGMTATSVLMSRPAYTNWMLGYMRLRAAIQDGTDRTVAPLLRHVSGLERMAQDNPALWPVYGAVVNDIETLQDKRGTTGQKAPQPPAAKATPEAPSPQPKQPSQDQQPRQMSPARKAEILRMGREAIANDPGHKSEVENRLRRMGIDPREL